MWFYNHHALKFEYKANNFKLHFWHQQFKLLTHKTSSLPQMGVSGLIIITSKYVTNNYIK